MVKYRTPGVTYESADQPARVVKPVRSDIAGFVGVAQRGPLHVAVKIESWQQFVSWFGAHFDQGYLAYAVQGFFDNSGRTCFVVRVGNPEGAVWATLDLDDDANPPQPALRLTAIDDGPQGTKIRVQVSWPPAGDAEGARRRFTLTLEVEGGGLEVWPDLTLDDVADPRYALKVVNRAGTGSRLVSLDVLGEQPGRRPAATNAGRAPLPRLTLPPWARDHAVLAGLKPMHFSGEGAPEGKKWGLCVLADIDQVSLVAAPDIVWQAPTKPAKALPKPRCDAPPAPAPELLPPPISDVRTAFDKLDIDDLRGALMRHCEALGDRFALIDPSAGAAPNEVLAQAQGPRSNYAALYYPWLLVPDPLQDPGAVVAVPPSGHVAGVCARVDLSIGVQKPPANEVLVGVQGVERSLDLTDLGDLNEGRVNAIRALPGRGIRIYGARTLAHDDQPQWLYVNVRRLLLMIETAINGQTQWAVHEPNSTRLRRALERVVRSFLDSLWRLGYLDGGSAEQAYSVVCDDTTNPPGDADLGRITCLVGVLPPAPAEFVVVRIGVTDGASSADLLPEGREDV